MKRWVLLGLISTCLGRAHEPITTKLAWTREISRIFYKRCISCHHSGGSAPMSLVTYEEARPWAKAIKEEVLERRMPPWDAVKGFGDFRNDPSLSVPEIDMIVNWVEGGAPGGDEIYLLSAPGPAPEDPPPPPSTTLALQGVVTLTRSVTALGIAPEKLPAGGSLHVTARRLDGSLEPLLWIRNYNPRWQRTYYFREVLEVPKGTQIRVDPSEGRAASLIISAPKQVR